MKLYEIDQQIMNLADPETGEITNFEAFEALQMKREAKIESLCLWYKDLIGDAEKIKKEKLVLADRQKAAENKAASVKKFLDYVLNGEKFKTAKCAVSYRKSEAVSIDEDFVEWAKDNADDLLSYKEPTANLTAIKEAIKNGRDVKFAEVEAKNNINIK